MLVYLELLSYICMYFFFLYLDFTSIASLLMASRFLEGYYSEIFICESGPSGCFLFFLGLMTLKRKEMVIKQLRCNWFYLSPCTDSFSQPLATFLLSSPSEALALTSLLQRIPVLWVTPPTLVETMKWGSHSHAAWVHVDRAEERREQVYPRPRAEGKVLTGKMSRRKVRRWGKGWKFEGLRTGET